MNQLLKEKISNSGMTITAISDRMGIQRHTLYNKISGKNEFTASEIVILTDLLHLNKAERDEIFLSKKLN